MFGANSAYFDALNFVKHHFNLSEEHDDLARLAHHSQEIIVHLEHALRLVNTALRNAFVLCDRAEARFYECHHRKKLETISPNSEEDRHYDH